MIVISDSADSRAVADVLALLGRQSGLQRQVGHADDGVHRRADLMAHVGQEFSLGHRRLLGALARHVELSHELRETLRVLLQRLLGGPAVRHIAGHGIDESHVD